MLLNLINHKPDNDKILLYAKDTFEAKYLFFLNKREQEVQTTSKIRNLSLNTEMTYRKFIKTLINATQ